MNITTLLLSLVLAMAVVAFGAQNTQAVTFHFLLFKVPAVPLVLPLFGAVLAGALLGWIVSVPGRLRRMRTRHGLEGEITAYARADEVRQTQTG
jgi:uncharacterized integral membrane protein